MKSNNIVELKDVKKTYLLGETKVEALRGVSLSIAKGEFTTLVGRSGSGKSTLLNLLGCLDRADSGDVIIDSQNIKGFTEDQLSGIRNHKIGFIFQSFHLIPVLSVYENVELPLTLRPEISERERRNSILQAIEEVGLSDFIKNRPDQLSGGQRQRVAIARALVKKPDLILADEPTANLDSETTFRIIDLLLKLNQEKKITFFFCSHDDKLIGRVARVITIQDGKVGT